MDLELDQAESAEEFASEPKDDIWTQSAEDDEADTPAFLRRRKRNKDNKDS